MKFQSLNNATTIITSDKDKIVLDPWAVGHLYQNSWGPFPKIKLKENYFKSTTHVIISHLHADHYDPETLKHINKSATIIIPKFKFNTVISKTLEKLKFKNIKFLSLSSWHKISNNISIFLIPPINEMGQNFDQYKKFPENSNIAIDTGIIIADKNTDTKHILLADNTPYNLKNFKKYIGQYVYDSLWFPYNGFAKDYPLCMDNISLNEKKKISMNMCITREKTILEAIKLSKPRMLFPYSSDFLLSGPYEDDFFKVNDDQFFHKYKYANRIEKLTKIKSLALYGSDNIIFEKNKKIIINIQSTINDKNIEHKKKELFFPKVCYKNTLRKEINDSLQLMFERLKKYNLSQYGIKNWNLNIKTEKELFSLDFKNQKVYTGKDVNEKTKNKKILLLKSKENIIRGLVQKKIHFDNAQIGCYLSWERYPAKEYCKPLYDALCFLHL